jgi:ribosomal protein L7Ae-like RNA K-turn-binding protein
MAKGSAVPKKSPAKRKSVWNKIKEIDHGTESLQKRENLFKLLQLATAKSGLKKLSIGTNSVMKSVQKGSVGVVCVCRDTPRNLFDALSEACIIRKVPLLCLPDAASKELAHSFALKRASCFSVPIQQVKVTDAENESEIDGIVDGIRDAALSMCPQTSR